MVDIEMPGVGDVDVQFFFNFFFPQFLYESTLVQVGLFIINTVALLVLFQISVKYSSNTPT